MWGLITGSIAGLIDGLLILVAYLLYPIVVVIFGFFYIFYGSILYIFGPIVIALMPLGGANRLAKSYIENIFVWNAWPILYGGFGALLTAVQMGQVGQMLNQNDFLGGLGNLEGSFLIGIVSIVYSLAIAVIPFIAKRIISGDVGSTAVAMVGTAVTALTAGAAGIEGAAAGVAAARAGSAGATSAGASSSATAGSARALTSAAGGNQPAAPQQIPAASSFVIFGFFYIFYGSILYIFGPIVIALMPLGGANRLAKSYIENIFIWNAWPILYGGFGALLSAVQMGQIGQMLNQNNFLGGLGNLEGSILDRHREHCLLSGDRRHSLHRETNCERGCREYSSGDGGYGSHCADRRSGGD